MKLSLPTHDQAAEVPKPSEGACHLPALAIAPQLTPRLGLDVRAAALVREDQFNAMLGQAGAQGISVYGAIIQSAFCRGRQSRGLPKEHLGHRRKPRPSRVGLERSGQPASTARPSAHPLPSLAASRYWGTDTGPAVFPARPTAQHPQLAFKAGPARDRL